MTSATPEEHVSLTVDKFYARPAAGDVQTPLLLKQLIFLEVGPEAEINAIEGAERFVIIQDDHYTGSLFASATKLDRLGRFAHFSRLARDINMARFVRPIEDERFRECVDLVAQYMKVIAGRPSAGLAACAR